MTHHALSTRLYFVMAFLLLAAVGVGVIGVVGLARTNRGLQTVYDDRVVPLKQLKQIADAYAVSVIDAANKANAGLMTAEETLKAVVSVREELNAQAETSMVAVGELEALVHGSAAATVATAPGTTTPALRVVHSKPVVHRPQAASGGAWRRANAGDHNGTGTLGSF